ncbi:DUF3994 domain-containing protein [Bacillus sp. HNG]|uniref:DUF3994 domain-containing protein n=1 Tax=Bacillus sp. HNG TaxID=2293325 RepID=UPI00167842E5|nr:DUF3994 domain-containing protein [Bacillus sp. HNG]
MKLKMVRSIILSALILSLVGCQALEGSSQGKTKSPKIEKSEPLTEEEYEVTVSETSQEFYKELTEMLTKLMETKTVDDEMHNWLIEKVNNMQNLSNKVLALTPPSSYEKVDNYYKDSMNEFQIYLKGFQKGLEKKDLSLVKDVYENSLKGEQLLNHANALLSLTYDIPVGDGTITSADLKALDKNAGIDRDSVLLHVSEDGKELSGKWGTRKEDGTLTISIVLNEDGSYEGYGNGEYPDQSNVMKGTWKYEFLTHTIHFTNDEVYKNGSLTESPRPTMKMDLQSFKNGKIQLFDLETGRTFPYEKE